MEIQIGRSGRECVVCEKEFEHEQPHVSLVRIADGTLDREDYCNDCWKEELAENAYSVWESQYYDPRVAEQAPAESFSPLRQSFYEAAEQNDRPSLAVAYLAGQLLRRQKVFRLIKETTDPDTEAALLLFSDRIGNRLIEVKDPNLSHAELDAARGTLMEKLNALESPEEETEETADGSLEQASA